MTETDYTKLLIDYQDLKLDAHSKRNEIIDTVKEWFDENHPIPALSVYVNDRVHIDQLCLISVHKISGEILKEFGEVFGLEINTEFYQIRREHGGFIRNGHLDLEKWKYSFKIK